LSDVTRKNAVKGETKPGAKKTRSDRAIEIYCDGACSGNPGPGGYGAILKFGDTVKEISGCHPNTTNNRMEMTALIEALRLIKRPSRIRVTTDSNYLLKGMTEWVPVWKRNNWINSRKKPVLNRDLWERLLELSKGHEIEWKWIKGHAGHKENERCDALAREALQQCQRRPEEREPVPDEWLDVLGCMTYGIYVLTARYKTRINGMIASWVSQVSYAPPLVLVAVHPNQYTHELIEKSNAFALHLLRKDQKDFLERFKGPQPGAKFKSIDWVEGASGCPILKDSLGFIECRVIEKYTPGNHTLYVGQVLSGRLHFSEDPLNTSDYGGVYLGKD